MCSKVEDDHSRNDYVVEIQSDVSDEDQPTIEYGDSNDKQKDDIKTHHKYQIGIQWVLLTLFLLGISLSVASLTSTRLRSTRPIVGLAIWQWSLLITALLAGPMLSIGLKKFVLFYTDHYSNEVYYLVMLLSNAWAVLYFSLILLVWTWVVNQPSYLNAPRTLPQEERYNILIKFAHVKHIVTLTIITILLGSFLWLLKDLGMMYGKKWFHTMRFFDRIRESLMDEYRIKILTSQPQVRSPPKELVYEEKNICGKVEKKSINLTNLNVAHGKVSSWKMKKLVDRMINGRPLVYMDGNKEVKFDSENKATEVSRIIVSSLASPGPQGYQALSGFTKEQINEGLSKKHFDESEAHEVTKWLLKGANTKKINKELVKLRMIRAWRQRNALIRAMQCNKRIFQQLNIAVNVILVIVIFIVWLVMLKVEIRRAMVVVGSAIVGSAFIFGDFCKKLFDSLLFIFGRHPFDVGDCCLIGDTMVQIDEIFLFTTVAYTLNHEKRYYPHSILVGQIISNYTRSRPCMGDSVLFYLDIHTPEGKIKQLKKEIKSYIRDNPHDWNANHLLTVDFEMKDDGKSFLKTTLQFQHTINYHDFKERQARRYKLIMKIKKILEDLKILQDSKNKDHKP